MRNFLLMQHLTHFYKAFLNNLTREQAIYCLVEACKSAYSRGSFKLDESEALSRALRVIGEI
jgi:hypothetical protein